MRAILEFQLPEEQEEFESAVNGADYKDKLDEVWDKLFRPRHKHGYNNDVLNELDDDEKVSKAIDLLEEIYKEIIHRD